MTKYLKIEKGSGNIFRDFGFSPGETQKLREDFWADVVRFGGYDEPEKET